MRRRQFVQTAPAAVAFALVGCGGGGGGGDSVALDPLSEDLIDDGTGRKIPRPTSSTGSVSGTGYPFGSRKDAYVPGTITPTNRTNAQMDAELKAKYDAWKRALVVSVPTVAGGLAIRFHSNEYLCVSEGMGYGMLLAVLFAGHDPGAKALFDGLLTTVRARPARGTIIHYGPWGKDLMDWRLRLDGLSSDPNNVGWNAMDGDLDIAMALLMADRQWGSTGQWNYLQEGRNTIYAIKMMNMKEDGTTKGLP
ncbi:MAG TPA: glycosyl hydrolase family 8, partial [Ramlibacter sp.]|nr:glycosyl hydrolase family 8 [Ramlibacter sp.]